MTGDLRRAARDLRRWLQTEESDVLPTDVFALMLRLADARLTAGPTWTETPPDRPGWYWMRRSQAADERVREVCEADRDGRRVLLVVEKNGAFPVPGHYDGYQWAGPIPEPTEPTA